MKYPIIRHFTSAVSWSLLMILVALVAAPLQSAGQSITRIIDGTGDGSGNILDDPFQVATDPSGNVFVVGWISQNVFKITTDGTITEIIDKNGNAAGDTLAYPEVLATDGDGNAYVAGSTSDNVFKITPAGLITEIIDHAGNGADDTLRAPRGLATDGSGNVYVSGYWSHNVFRITPGGTITEIMDESGDGGGNDLQNPRGIAIDNSGNVFVAGQGSNNVFKIRPSGTITEIIDQTGDGAGNSLFDPHAIVTNAAGNVYVSTDFSRNVLRFAPDSTIKMIISSSGDGLGNGLGGARSLAIDAQGNVFVAGKDSDNAFRITQDGTITEIIDETGSPYPLDGLNDPRGIATDDKGNVFVGSRLTSSVFKIDLRSVVTVYAYLEGAYTGGGLMTTALNPVLPLTQPFSGEPWLYSGNESVSSMPGNVVDWLLAEIRTDTAASTTVARQAVLLLEDGSVLDASATEPPRFIHPGHDSVFVVVRHRNHLDVMSIDKVDLTVTPIVVDFTAAGSAFGTDPQKHIPGVGHALHACDIRADDVVNSLDIEDFASQTSGGASGYQPADVNNDGTVQAIDFILCLENVLNAAASQVP